MDSDNAIALLLIVGLGGVAIWLLMKPAPVSTADNCKVPISVYGVGTVLPCSTVKQSASLAVSALGSGIKQSLTPWNIVKGIGGDWKNGLKHAPVDLSTGTAVPKATADQLAQIKQDQSAITASGTGVWRGKV